MGLADANSCREWMKRSYCGARETIQGPGINRHMNVRLIVTQLCPTLWDPVDYIVLGILQARMLEWVAFPFSSGSSQPRG